jgi:DNA-binding response OmpR family regulator
VADLNPKKVLVVDADADTIDRLDHALRDRGYQPVFVRRGAQAMKRVKDEKPGAVILELALPDRDGRAVIKELKDDWDVKKVPIVVLSNYPNRLDRANRDRVEAVFDKPGDVEAVLSEVERVIQKAQKS